jgi:hypothetical protein
MQTRTLQLEPRTAPFQVRVDWGTPQLLPVNIDAYTARKRVTGWAMGEVGTSCGGGLPQLVVEREQVYWRVPVVWTKLGVGEVGEIGAVNVDAQTGEMAIVANAAEQMLSNAIALTKAHAKPESPSLPPA